MNILFKITMAWLIFQSVAWGSFSVCAHAEQSLKSVRISTFHYPPFMDRDKISGLQSGFGLDIVKAAFGAVGIEPEFEFFPMKRAIYLFHTGQSVVNLGTSKQFREMEKMGDIIGVQLFRLRFVFFYLSSAQGDIRIQGLADLRPYSIGNVRGSATYDPLKKAGLKMDLVHSIDLNFKKLIFGRIDLCVSEELTGNRIVEQYYPEKLNELAVIEPPIMTIPMHLNFAATQRSLARRFDLGMKRIRKTRQFDRIAEHYFGPVNVVKLQ